MNGPIKDELLRRFHDLKLEETTPEFYSTQLRELLLEIDDARTLGDSGLELDSLRQQIEAALGSRGVYRFLLHGLIG